MLIVVKILIAVCIWLVIPVLLGSLWLRSGEKLNERFLYAYLIGLMSEWAVFFVLAKWAIARQILLHELCRLWVVMLILLTLFALAWGIKAQRFSVRLGKRWGAESLFGIVGLVILIGAGIVCGGNSQKEYTVESVLTMYATDSLYQYDVTTGQSLDEMTSFQEEELENAAKAPIDAYYAANSFLCRLNPAKYVRILLPLFLMIFYFSVYLVWAYTLFGENRIKRVVFQVVVWLLYAGALVSERAVLFQVFQNCWNGETLFFAGLVPLAVWLLLGEDNRKRWIMQYIVCVLAGQLLYRNGGFVISFLWGIALLVTGIKRWKNDSSI